MMGLEANAMTMGLLALLTLAGAGWLALDWVWSDKSKVASRAQTILGASPTLRRSTAGDDEQAKRRKKVVKDLKNLRAGATRKFNMSDRAAQAGIAMPVPIYFISFISAGALLFIMLAMAVRMHPLLAATFGATVAFGMPIWILGVLRGKRMKKFTAEFPNAIDVIVRGIKSGLPVPECLNIIARESPEPVAGEFKRLVESTAMGVDLEQGLQKMYERMPTPEVNFFRVVIAIQKKTGGNLAEALGNLSTVIRARKMLREKVKALAAEAVSSAFIIASLPLFVLAVVMVTTPGYMQPMFNDPRGKMMLLFCVIWEFAGILVMRKMINFKY